MKLATNLGITPELIPHQPLDHSTQVPTDILTLEKNGSQTQCVHFARVFSKERIAIVRSAGLCFNCPAHLKVAQCTSKFSCKQCKKKHRTSLCHALCAPAEPPQAAPPSSSQSTTKETTNQTSDNTPTNQTNNSTITGSYTTVTSPPLPALYTSVCLLKTAIADISTGVTTVEGHILCSKVLHYTRTS